MRNLFTVVKRKIRAFKKFESRTQMKISSHVIVDAIHTSKPVTGKINTDKRPLDENTIFQQLYA